jgi:hypothetical protein
MACTYRGAPNDAVVSACILEAAGNTAFWQCLHKIRGIREIRGSFLLLKDISMTTGLNAYPPRILTIRGYSSRGVNQHWVEWPVLDSVADHWARLLSLGISPKADEETLE